MDRDPTDSVDSGESPSDSSNAPPGADDSTGDEATPTGPSVGSGATKLLDDIVFVLVPAADPAVAKALATGGLQYRENIPPHPDGIAPRETFEFVEDFDDVPLNEITDWSNLPDSVMIDSALGSKLFDQVRATIDWESQSRTLLYDQYGTGFDSPADLDVYLEEHDDLRLVLAVSYQITGGSGD